MIANHGRTTYPGRAALGLAGALSLAGVLTLMARRYVDGQRPAAFGGYRCLEAPLSSAEASECQCPDLCLRDHANE
ncbi:MAG: hypothetical protein HY690_04475 [Chloroflexi bacterium]|nr:hypothetical protein [Chloroflexota bacterium]